MIGAVCDEKQYRFSPMECWKVLDLEIRSICYEDEST